MNKIYYFLLCMIFLGSCQLQQKDNNSDRTQKWSSLMANSIVTRWDSIAGPNKTNWTYDVSMLVRAIYLANEDSNYKFFKDYVDYFISSDGTIRSYNREEYNIDRIQPGRNLFYLYHKTKDEKYKKAIEYLLEQMISHPRTTSGGYWHKKIYPNQMWLDGIYMACPFMAQYASEFNQPQWFDEVVKQIALIYQNTVDPKTGLLYHAFDESRKEKWCNPVTGQSPNFWSRAMGWYAMAIVDVLDFLPQNHSGREKLISILQNISKSLLKVQDSESGLWYQVLNMGEKEGNYLEASGSAMFTYAFAKGARKGYLEKNYLDVANKSFNGLITVLTEKDENGNVNLTHVCGGCGLGGNPYRDGSYQYYINEKIVVNDSKGVAPFIFASLELKR